MSELRGNFCPPKQEKELFLPLDQTGVQILDVHYLGCEAARVCTETEKFGVHRNTLNA